MTRTFTVLAALAEQSKKNLGTPILRTIDRMMADYEQELLRGQAFPPGPELAHAARALYIADHAQNPYAATDWANETADPDSKTVKRYTGLARTTLTAYELGSTR